MPNEMKQAWIKFFQDKAKDAKSERDNKFFLSIAQSIEDYTDDEDSVEEGA